MANYQEWRLETDDKLKPTAGTFIWPLQSTPGFNYNYGISNFVDLNPLYPNHLLDWNCGKRTYDTPDGNHQGLDIYTWPFGQLLQENSLAKIIAAAEGVIIGIDDGHTDHSCSMNVSTPWNAVYIGNTDGTICWYGHMKKNSTTSKQVGEKVAAGEVLGVVGSSGMSTGPHLHFEVHSKTGDILEPFSGPCNPSASLWADQKPYIDPKINLILTHNHLPVFPACPQQETIHAKDTFTVGDTLMFVSYFHDQTNNKPANYTITAPDQSLFKTWKFTSNEAHYSSSYFYWMWMYDNQWVDGKYTFQVAYEGDTLRHDFWVFQQMPSSVPQLSGSNNSFSIFPNPNSGSFQIQLLQNTNRKQSLVKIMDITGRQLWEKPIAKNEEFMQINLNLVPGIYFLNVIGKEEKTTKSFVVH